MSRRRDYARSSAGWGGDGLSPTNLAEKCFTTDAITQRMFNRYRYLNKQNGGCQ